MIWRDADRGTLARVDASTTRRRMMDIDMMPEHIEYKDGREYERERAEGFRTAALLGYGAMLAQNSDGRFKEVLVTLDKILWPQPIVAPQ
jgi:hypothetical protein